MDLLLACTLLVEPPPRPRPRPRLLPLSPRWEGLLDVRFMKYLDANDGICFDQPTSRSSGGNERLEHAL